MAEYALLVWKRLEQRASGLGDLWAHDWGAWPVAAGVVVVAVVAWYAWRPRRR